MDNKPWISVYEPKEWVIHEVGVPSAEWNELKTSLRDYNGNELLVCIAESQYALDRWMLYKSVKGLLFSDIEQLWAMGLDKMYGVGRVGVLLKEWMGHEIGSLVMETYKGANLEPRFFTIGVAKGVVEVGVPDFQK